MHTSLIQNNLRFKVTKYNQLYHLDVAFRLICSPTSGLYQGARGRNVTVRCFKGA